MIVYRGKTKKGKEVVLRYPKRGDVIAMTNYINALSRERTFVLRQGEQITRKEEEKILANILKGIKVKNTILLLAFSGKNLVGISGVHQVDKTVRKHVGELAISVSKNFRGERIGEILMREVIKESKRKLSGLTKIILDVFSINTKARRLYTKLGFRQYGVLPKGLRYKGKLTPEVLMHKDI